MTEVFYIDYPPTPAGKKHWAKEYGMNRFYAGVHWSKRKEAADYWHRLVHSCMERQGVRRIPFEKPVIISMYFNDRLDCSNHAIYFKFIEDAMKGRIIRDDSQRWVKGCEMYFHDEDCIKVVVRTVSEEKRYGKAGR